jgi:GT2 family glycosyltransferase
MDSTGAVIIGRNEGERLKRCLESLTQLKPRVVYVDSGSTDGSVESARNWGADVVCLDNKVGFTAARARNAGWRRLSELWPCLTYVQFVDGDCEISDGWLAIAVNALNQSEALAVVCGRRRECHPERSMFNLLCDMEWNTPPGPARSCGGDAMMRLTAIRQTGGYRDSLIAGEEPELCVRLRQLGWTIERIRADMCWHDAAMTQLWQWIRRTQRSGYAYAEGAALHGAPPERHFVRQSWSIWFWAFLWPLMIATTCLPTRGLSLIGLAAYPALALRTAWNRRRAVGDPVRHCLIYGLACVAAKWPQLSGQMIYWTNRWRGRRGRIIEYRQAKA